MPSPKNRHLTEVNEAGSPPTGLDDGKQELQGDVSGVVLKKRKRKVENDSASKETVVTIPEPPRKKRKNRTEFADPRDDTSLSSQSRKALGYAFTQMNKPSKWKFNKARQNWILRNVWSSEVLPDTYFPLALKYLSKVQGGSRDKLNQMAQIYLKPKEPEKAVTFAEPARETKIKPTPGPLISTSPSPTPASSTLSAAQELDNTRKARAQKILDVFSSASSSDSNK